MPVPFIDDFRNPAMVRGLLERLHAAAARLDSPLRVMEVCGTHTMAISRHGIRKAIPRKIELISGPGCPVCVTSNRDIDAFIEMADAPGVIATTFGDMLRVPGTRTGLAEARSRGADVRIVYSLLDALDIARAHPESPVIFFGVGFETTAPTVAAALVQARAEGLANFFVYCAHKLVPPALEALASSARLEIDAFLCPGHVSAIIGARAYEPIAAEHGIPCVIAGFEPVDILQSLFLLVEQASAGEAKVETEYSRGVRPEGNPAAMELMHRVFAAADTQWRGLGKIPHSGLVIKEEFAAHDAGRAFDVDVSWSREPTGCICGRILTGVSKPPDCPQFGQACTPEHPVGPCMVSSEGTCAAYFQYEIQTAAI